MIVQPPSSIFSRNLWHKSPKKSRKTQKMAIFTKKSKFFIKAKLTASKSCLLGPTCSMIFSIFRDAHLKKVKYLKSPSYNFWNFSYAQLHWHSKEDSYHGSSVMIVRLNEGTISNFPVKDFFKHHKSLPLLVIISHTENFKISQGINR